MIPKCIWSQHEERHPLLQRSLGWRGSAHGRIGSVTLELVVDYFLSQPRRLVALGRGLLNVAGLIMVAAAVAHAATTAASIVRGIGGGARPSMLLTELLPSVPTWWVPESAMGLCLAVLIALGGAIALHTGRMYEKLLR